MIAITGIRRKRDEEWKGNGKETGKCEEQEGQWRRVDMNVIM